MKLLAKLRKISGLDSEHRKDSSNIVKIAENLLQGIFSKLCKKFQFAAIKKWGLLCLI